MALRKYDDDLHDSERLWRYMDFDQFVHVLATSSLWLAPLSAMEDKREGRWIRLDVPKFQDTFEQSYEFAASQTVISSWVAADTESLPMWNSYTSPATGVAISTDVHSLLRALAGKSISSGGLPLAEDARSHAEGRRARRLPESVTAVRQRARTPSAPVNKAQTGRHRMTRAASLEGAAETSAAPPRELSGPVPLPKASTAGGRHLCGTTHHVHLAHPTRQTTARRSPIPAESPIGPSAMGPATAKTAAAGGAALTVGSP